MTNVMPYVLVGGRSSRMGRDKAFVPWQGITLLQHAIQRLAPFGTARLLSGDADNTQRAMELAPFGPLVPDRTPGGGPLGGVDAALHDVVTTWALILPIDQPCLPMEALLDWSRQVTATTATASWFRLPHGPEPLPLLLHRSLAPVIAQAFTSGQRRLLSAVTLAAGSGAMPFAGDDPEWFRNLNSPHDLEEVA